MASGPNITPRGYNIVTDPERFNGGISAHLRHQKRTDPEIVVFNNESNSSGVTVYSDNLRVAPATMFSVVTGSGTGNTVIEGAISVEGPWTVLSTISGAGNYSNSTQAFPWVRIGLADGVSGQTVQFFRKYETF